MTFISYRLPDGRIVPVDADVCRGASAIDFTLADGAIVLAVIEPRQTLATETERRAAAMDENEHIPFEDKIIAYETAARARRALAPLVRCCFCGVERDDPRARLVCVAPTNATAFHHFSEPAPASRLAALDNLSYAADRLDETAALLRAIAAECTGVAPCYCPAERAAAVPEREPGMCDLCGGRKLDAIDAVRR